MSSSLVDSIFGAAPPKEAAAPDAATLFDTKVDVPEPHQYPVLKKKRKKPTVEADNDKKKKQRKPTAPSADGEKTAVAAAGDEKAEATKTAVEIGPHEKPPSETDVKEEDVDDRTVFVGNLPLHYTRRALFKLFSDCGKIESTRIRSVAAAGVKLPPSHAGNQNLVKKVCSNTQKLDASAKLSVLGYVVFVERKSVEAAVLKNNLAVPESDTVIKTTAKSAAVRHIRVDRVSQPVKDPARTVFVGNLPYAADEESLGKHVFDKLNASNGSSKEELIEGVRIVRDKDTQLCKGFGYILFRDTTTAATALKTCHETKYMQKALRVQVCGKRYKNKQGATTQPKAVSRRKAELADSVGALKRVLTKQLTVAPRKRAERKKGAPAKANKAGVSKRAASEAKTGKRIKKIEKRLTKGMGKTRK